MTIRKKDWGLKDCLKRNNDLQTSLLFVRMFHMKHSDFLFIDVSYETLIVTQK